MVADVLEDLIFSSLHENDCIAVAIRRIGGADRAVLEMSGE